VAGLRGRKAARAGGKFGLRYATVTIVLPIFRVRLAPPLERQVKTYKPGCLGDLRSATGLLQRSAACHHHYKGGAKDKISIYIVNRNFSKIVAFERIIRKVLNMVDVHAEGLRYPPICLFDIIFCVSVPLIMPFFHIVSADL
jgi:hypothetical protein